MSPNKICRLDELPANGAKGMVALIDGKQRNIFIIRWENKVYAYLNWCPHNQALIDQIPGRFFNDEKSLIRCSKHGALFRIKDGYCVEGPCEGESLKAVSTEIREGEVFL